MSTNKLHTENEIKAYFTGLRMGLHLYSPEGTFDEKHTREDELKRIDHNEEVALELSRQVNGRR